jgi:hypothetical protein
LLPISTTTIATWKKITSTLLPTFTTFTTFAFAPKEFVTSSPSSTITINVMTLDEVNVVDAFYLLSNYDSCINNFRMKNTFFFLQ